jgi:hypothetical protein
MYQDDYDFNNPPSVVPKVVGWILIGIGVLGGLGQLAGGGRQHSHDPVARAVPFVLTVGLIVAGIVLLNIGSKNSRDRIRRLKQARHMTHYTPPTVVGPPLPPFPPIDTRDGHPEIVLDLDER